MTKQVSHRFGDLKFPQDRYNIMYEVKKAMIKCASRIKGNPEKKKVFDETIALLIGHTEAKFKHDKAKRDELRKAAEEAAEHETVNEDVQQTDTDALEAELFGVDDEPQE